MENHRLDTVGRLWPLINTKRMTAFFRISVEFKNFIDLTKLQQSLKKASAYFPGFFMEVRSGFFWPYLAPTKWENVLLAEQPWPCLNEIHHGNGMSRPLLRVIPWQNRLALEFSHAITDGIGASKLIKWLVAEYLADTDSDNLIDHGHLSSSESWENAYARYSMPGLFDSSPHTAAFSPKSALTSAGKYRLITGMVETKDIRSSAKEMDLKVGEFLAAIMLYSLQLLASKEIEQNKKISFRRVRKKIRVLIPVDLRALFPSQTMRNFFAYVAPEIDMTLGRLSLDEIAHEVRWQMRGNITPWRLRAQFSQHNDLSRTLMLRLVPYYFKRMLLVTAYPFVGERQFSCSLSNLGQLELDESSVERVIFIPPPSPWNKTNVSIISFGKQTAITFGSVAVSADVEREFFRCIVKYVGKVKISQGTQ